MQTLKRNLVGEVVWQRVDSSGGPERGREGAVSSGRGTISANDDAGGPKGSAVSYGEERA